MFGWILLVYLVVGFIVTFGTMVKFYVGLSEMYSTDIIGEAMSHLNEMTAQTINDDPAGSLKNLIINLILWPKLGNSIKDVKQYLTSECEFISNLK